MALLYSSVLVSHASEQVSWHAKRQEPKTEEAKWKSAIIHFIICTCAFANVACGMLSIKKLIRWFLRKGQTWPSVCEAPAYAVGPRLRWRAGLAAASLAQSAACAGRRRSGETQNKRK